jgi:hypothetical protein
MRKINPRSVSLLIFHVKGHNSRFSLYPPHSIPNRVSAKTDIHPLRFDILEIETALFGAPFVLSKLNFEIQILGFTSQSLERKTIGSKTLEVSAESI